MMLSILSNVSICQLIVEKCMENIRNENCIKISIKNKYNMIICNLKRSSDLKYDWKNFLRLITVITCY